MLKDRHTTERYLRDSDRNARCAALCLLMDHWGPDETFARVCEEMAFADPDVQVRCAAVTILGSYYQGTNNARMGEILAKLAKDEASDLKVREAAYRSLYTLCGLPSWECPPLVNFQLLRDADWQFVDSFIAPT
jgi:HEAT repeat protein